MPHEAADIAAAGAHSREAVHHTGAHGGIHRAGDRSGEAAGFVAAAHLAQTVTPLDRSGGADESSKAAYVGVAAYVTLGVAVVDAAGVVAGKSAYHVPAGDGAGGGAAGDGACVVAHQSADLVVCIRAAAGTVDGDIGAAVVDGAGHGEAGIAVGLAVVQTHQATDADAAGDGAADGAVTDEVGDILRQVGFVQLHLCVTHQAADVRVTGDGDVLQRQIGDGSTLDDVEEAHVARAADGDVLNGVVLAVKLAGERRCGAADTGERHVLQVKVGGQAVVLSQFFRIRGICQFSQLVNGADVHPLHVGVGQFLPGGTLEVVLGGALEPQQLIAVPHRSQRRGDVGKVVVDGEHPAVRIVHGAAVDSVDEPAEGGRSSVAIRQLALRHRRIHHVHHTGVAVAVHGEGDGVAHFGEAVGGLVVGGDSDLHRDLRGGRTLRCSHTGQIRQTVVLRVVPRPSAADQQSHKGGKLHLCQEFRHCTVSISGHGAVVVAVVDALALLNLECGIGLVAADEAVALRAGDGDGTGGVAVLIDVAAVHRSPHKAAGVVAGGDVAQREAVLDGAAVAKTHEAAGVGASGADSHGRPALLDKGAFLVGTHETGVAGGRGAVGGQRAALHIAVADDAVVAADHAAQHRTDVGGNIGVENGAVLDGAAVVVYQHRRIVGEQHVGVLDGQVVDLTGSTHIPEQAGVVVAEGQAGDLVATAVKLAHEGIGDGADGLGFHLLGRREAGEVNIRRQTVVFAPLHLLLAGGTGASRRLVLHIGQFQPLLGGGDVDPLFLSRLCR